VTTLARRRDAHLVAQARAHEDAVHERQALRHGHCRAALLNSGGAAPVPPPPSTVTKSGATPVLSIALTSWGSSSRGAERGGVRPLSRARPPGPRAPPDLRELEAGRRRA